MEKYQFFHEKLTNCKARFQSQFPNADLRTINFSSHDFAALALHPEIKKRAIRSILQEGVGYTISKQTQLLEKRLANLLDFESVKLFASRSLLISSLLLAITSSKSHIFIDQGSHECLIQAALTSHSAVHLYQEGDLKALEEMLKEKCNTACDVKIIITESLFSYEGNICDLAALTKLAKDHGALLIVDDTASFGVKGEQGMGLSAGIEGIDIVLGSNCFGAYMASSQLVREYLMQTSSAVNEAHLSPPLIGAFDSGIDIILQMEGERRQLQQRSHWLRRQLQEIGFDTGRSQSHIIPLYFGEEEETKHLLSLLKDAEILAEALLPPVVQENESRVLLGLNILHTPDQLNHLLRLLKGSSKALIT